MISVLSMEIIRRGSRLCASSSTPGAAWGCNLKTKCVGENVLVFPCRPKQCRRKQTVCSCLCDVCSGANRSTTWTFAAAILALTYLERSLFFSHVKTNTEHTLSHSVWKVISPCCSLLGEGGESMFILLKANQARPVKKRTDSLVKYPPPLLYKKRFVRSYLIQRWWCVVSLCSYWWGSAKRRLGRQRAHFFYSHKTHSELQNTPNEGVQRCHVRHASFYQAG